MDDPWDGLWTALARAGREDIDRRADAFLSNIDMPTRIVCVKSIDDIGPEIQEFVTVLRGGKP